MPRTPGFLVAAILIFPLIVYAQKPEFSQENALALVKALAQEIGPRPMGSPAEQRALHFASAKFLEYGCEESYVMPMTVADGINTTSGIAVGVLKGKTGKIIIIGGHIDSSGPDVPGANDDASGSACVIELARVLAERQNQSTVLFCCWGGEEAGLLGSKYFVKHFAGIDSVRLMIQIDMADGAGDLEINPDAPGSCSPGWLAEAAYATYYDTLGYSDLVYSTSSAAMSLAAGGAYGSDHVPFLSSGIPAIDFTSDITFPIHTPQDRLENFTPSGLKRSGDLALRLFERFDAGTPSRVTERYMLFQLGSHPVLLPFWLLWSCVGLAACVSVIALGVSRQRRSSGGTSSVPWSGLRLLLFALFVQLIVRGFSVLIGALGGEKYPWVNNTFGFALFGIVSAVLAACIVLQITSRVKMSTDQFVYTRVAIPTFLLMVLVGSLLGPRLAVYPALSLLLFSLAVLVTSPMSKFLLMLGSLYPIFRLVFNELVELYLRAFAKSTRVATVNEVISSGLYVILFTLLSIPFIFGFSALYVDVWKSTGWGERLRDWKTVTGIAGILVVLGFYLAGRPIYDRLWHSVVRIEQQTALGSDSSRIEVRGSDYLRGLRIVMDGRDTTVADHTTFQLLRPRAPSRVTWCSLERQTRTAGTPGAGDSLSAVERTLHLHSILRPLRVDLSYHSDAPFDAISHWSHGARSRGRRAIDSETRFSWYAYPDTGLVIPVRFRMHEGQRIAESIVITYDSLAYPISASREFTNVSKRTIVTAADTIQSLPGNHFAMSGNSL